MSTSSASNPPSSAASPTTFPIRPYTPPPPSSPFPYKPSDFLRADESSDTDFYSQPRFVTHIDDNAISLLRRYYEGVLPRNGRVLDLCSSWISHFPPALEESAVDTKRAKNGEGGGEGLEVIGLGMNDAELKANPILSQSILQDLNDDPAIPSSIAPLAATVCVVSIDYLNKPVSVLSSLLENTAVGGSVHLIISNRCFPTKAVGRWLRVSEPERLKLVGDYLHFGGWKGIEIVEVYDGQGQAPGLTGMFGGGVDPLWVVRGIRGRTAEEAEKSEL